MTQQDCQNAEIQSGAQLVYCYNKGCGQKFDPTQNTEESCTFHPGPPYFHDAYKIWKCCNKRSTDFSTWLCFKGCSRGFHSSVKPTHPSDQSNTSQNVEPSSRNDHGAALNTIKVIEEQMIKWNGLNRPAKRPANDSVSKSRFILMPIEVGLNAQRSLARQLEKNAPKHTGGTSPTSFGPNIGATCKNHSCKAVFDGSEKMVDASGDCLHHPGHAVFHEGMKYWSCCQLKTSDFTQFLDQPGCVRANHCWDKPKQKDDSVREDWFQRCGLVHISLYCKGALPDKCVFEVDSNGLNLRVHLVHEYGLKDTYIEYSLFGQVQTNDCKAIVNERKVEMILRQAGPENWPRLRYDGGGGAAVSGCDGSAFTTAGDGDDDDAGQESELFCVGE